MTSPAAPHVSIVLPTFNAQGTLRAALRSIERQSLTNWECLIVDDGSTDATPQIANERTRSDSRFRLITRSHCGLVPALNLGIELSKSGYIARMDADDCMHPQRLQLQLDALQENEGLAGLGGQVRLFPRGQLRPGRLAYETWLNAVTNAADVKRERFIECPLAHPTLMLRSEVFRALMYQDLPWPEDYDLLLRAHAAGYSFGSLPKVVLAWRDHGQRLSRTSDTYSLEAFTQCRAFYLAQDFLSATPRYTLWGHGPTGRRLRTALGCLGHWPDTIVEVHPRRIGQIIHGAPVIAPAALSKAQHAPLIASVSGASARQEIRAHLQHQGWNEGTDFVCAA